MDCNGVLTTSRCTYDRVLPLFVFNSFSTAVKVLLPFSSVLVEARKVVTVDCSVGTLKEYEIRLEGLLKDLLEQRDLDVQEWLKDLKEFFHVLY